MAEMGEGTKPYEVFFTILNFVTDEQFASSVSAISEPLDQSGDESRAIIRGDWTRDTDTGHQRRGSGVNIPAKKRHKQSVLDFNNLIII